MTPVTQTLDSRCYVNEAHVSGGVPVMSRNVNDGKTAFYDAVPKREDGETRSGGWSPQDNRGRVPSGRTRLQNDHLGNTLAVLTEDGIDPVLSTPFGHSLDADPRPDRRFTGKPYDADLQAHVFPYRNYSTQTAAWTTADPAGFPDGPNRHFYAAVPTMGLDPLGLAAVFTIAIADFTSPIEDATYQYNYSAQGQVGIPHTVNITITGTRDSSDPSLYTLKRALWSDGSMRSNEELNLDFGISTNQSWNMSITGFPVFFKTDGSQDGNKTSSVYAQVFLGQTALTGISSNSVDWILKEL